MDDPTRPLRFDLDVAQAAADAWGFNCGPAALCAILGMEPDAIRPRLLDFERRGYMSPSLMRDVVLALHPAARLVYQNAAPSEAPVYPSRGLVRVQWGGPWTRPGVPIRVRYGKTHWIAVAGLAGGLPVEAFDVNAMCVGGWLPWKEWAGKLVPWLLGEAVPRADGSWWPTHCWEVRCV